MNLQPNTSNPAKLIDPNYGNSNQNQVEQFGSGNAPGSKTIGSTLNQNSSQIVTGDVDETMKNEGDKSNYKDITNSLMRTRKDLSKNRPPN